MYKNNLKQTKQLITIGIHSMNKKLFCSVIFEQVIVFLNYIYY